jgi:hypothetical protein
MKTIKVCYDRSGKLRWTDTSDMVEKKREQDFCRGTKMAYIYDKRNRLVLVYDTATYEKPVEEKPKKFFDKLFSGTPYVDSIQFTYNNKSQLVKETFIVGGKYSKDRYKETATFSYNAHGLLSRFAYGATKYTVSYLYR